MARCAQNARNQANSTVVCRQGSQKLAALRDRQEEMLRLHGLGTYTDDQIMAMLQSQHENGSGSGSGAAEDDESGDDD
nr:hypothetical protein [Tanacetum cinerariifolium]